MNTLRAKVSTIKSMDNLALVSFSFGKQKLEMISLGLSQTLKEGSTVILGVKATSITIAKEFQGRISTTNQLEARVESVKNGKLLSSIRVKIENSVLESLITSEASSLLHIKKGDAVLVFIKASDLSIIEEEV